MYDQMFDGQPSYNNQIQFPPPPPYEPQIEEKETYPQLQEAENKPKKAKKDKDSAPRSTFFHYNFERMVLILHVLIFSKPKLTMPKVEVPKINVKEKVANVSSSIKNAKMPTAREVKDSYVNSNFHQSFKMPLEVHRKVEVDQDELQRRKLVTEKKTPAELAQMRHPLDIPMPKIKFSSSKSQKTENAETR